MPTPFFEFRCGYCTQSRGGPIVAFTPVPVDPTAPNSTLVGHGSSARYQALVNCPHCRNHTFLDFVYRSEKPIEQQMYPINPAVRVLACFPEYPEPKAAPEIPEKIAAAYLEAQRVFNAGAYPSTLAACCTVIELIGDHFSITGTLHRVIDRLREQGVLVQSLADWAHTLRALRNEAMHAGMAVPDVDARECLAFLDLVLELLFVLPARVERFRGDRHPHPS